MNFDEPRPIVIDNGTGSIKAGFAEDNEPTVEFPAVIGRPDARQRGVMVFAGMDDAYIGPEAQQRRGMLALSYPMRHGVVTDWDDMEDIWHYTFWAKLQADPSQHNVLLTEAPLNPIKHRQLMLERMFESFQVPGCYVAIQAVLSLYASGLKSGVVLDSGDGVTHVVPVFEGYTIPTAIKRMNLAGRDLTEYLVQLVMEYSKIQSQDDQYEYEQIDLQSSGGLEIAREMKEGACEVALDLREEQKRFSSPIDENKNYHYYNGMPDGSTVRMGIERFLCPEALFNPALIGVEGMGAHQMIAESVKKCHFDIRKELASNIVLSGGSTEFRGMEERMQKEMRRLLPQAIVPKVRAPEERKFSVWIGGAILASLSNFQKMWIPRGDVSEYGYERLAMKDRLFTSVMSDEAK